MALGYTAELLSFTDRDTPFLALNPIFFVEAYTQLMFKVSTGIWKGTIRVDLKPFRIAPVDYQAAWNLHKYNDFCSSISFTREVAEVEVRLTEEVYECTTGIAGYIKENKVKDCVWELYEPMMRVYQQSLLSKYDESYDYRTWECIDPEASEVDENEDFEDVIIIEGDGVFAGDTTQF